MYCIPACRVCREAGSCPRGELPASPVPQARPRYTPRVKAIIIDKRKASWIQLACVDGHGTDAQTDELYSLWRPKGRGQKRKFYCEKCHAWVEAQRTISNPLPTEPLF